jgi:NADH dehydrogenase FAD-containing subunit
MLIKVNNGQIFYEEVAMSKNLVIVGGGAGGASVAAEARRRDPSLSVVMIEQGKYVSTAA